MTMNTKPLVTNNHTGVSKHLSGSGEVPRWRLLFEVRLKIGLGGQALLHNVKRVKREQRADLVAAALTYFRQIFWNNVGDSSCDPVLTLQVNVAKRLGVFVIRNLRIAFKVRARSLVMVGYF
jgi:hypothetical protein